MRSFLNKQEVRVVFGESCLTKGCEWPNSDSQSHLQVGEEIEVALQDVHKRFTFDSTSLMVL
jgi:hypothetical protein